MVVCKWIVVLFVLMLETTASAVLNVKDFGAKGDGVTDDTVAIQRAADALFGLDQARESHCVTRFYNAMIDSPFPAIVFPKGVYRVSGPVVFRRNTMLLGDGGAKIVNVSADSETFYFREAHRLLVENLTFEGGFCHLRLWTRNRDISYFHVRGCRFREAKGVAVVSDSFRDYNGENGPAPEQIAAIPSCETHDVVRGENGLYTMTLRPENAMTPYNNSTLIIVECCQFEENVTAIRCYSDGVTLRSCVFRAPVGVRSSQIRAGSRGCFGVEMYFRDLKLEFPGPSVPGRAAIAFDGGKLHVENSLIRADGNLAAVRSISHAGDWCSAAVLDLRDVTLDNGEAPVLSIAGPWFPNRMSVATLRSSSQTRRRVFAFDTEPDEAFIRDLPAAAAHLSGVPVEHCITIVTEGVDEQVFDCRVPPALRNLVRKPDPSVRRDYGYRTGAQFACDLPFGEVFRDETMGALCRKDELDDTEKFATLLARASDAGGGVIELPAKWIGISRGFCLPSNTIVTCRGRAVVDLKNDGAAAFIVPECADVALRNVMFVSGGCAIASSASKGRVRAIGCSFYGQKGPSIRLEADEPASFVCEMTGGQACTPFLYRGNAKFTMDAFWYQGSVAYPKEKTSKSYASMVNLKGGEMRIREMLGVPVYFRFFGTGYVRNKANHDALRGDYRWIDNFGDLISYSSRYGGEFGGLTPIYHYGNARTYMYGGIVEGGEGGFRNSGPAPVVADSPTADVTLADVVTTVHRQPLQVIWRKDGKSGLVKSARLSNNYPYGY